MKKSTLILAFIFFFSTVYTQTSKTGYFDCDIYISTSDSLIKLKKCAIKQFDNHSVTVIKQSLQKNFSEQDYKVSRFIFKDLEELKIRKRRSIFLFTFVGAAVGALAGGFIGGVIYYSAHSSGGGDFDALANLEGSLRVAGTGFWFGMAVGGTAGLVYSNNRISLPLNPNEWVNRKLVLQSFQKGFYLFYREKIPGTLIPGIFLFIINCHLCI